MSECTALLGQRLGFRGVSDSGFSSCTMPTSYCRSKYFYRQHPQVWNLIRTEHSLNREELRFNNKLELFPICRNWIMEIRVMLEVTRGQVDNENNHQSQYLNISNNIQSEGLIYKSEIIAIRNGKYWSMGWNTAR